MIYRSKKLRTLQCTAYTIVAVFFPLLVLNMTNSFKNLTRNLPQSFNRVFLFFITLTMVLYVFIIVSALHDVISYKRNLNRSKALTEKISAEREIICHGPARLLKNSMKANIGWMILTKSSLEFYEAKKNYSDPICIPLSNIKIKKTTIPVVNINVHSEGKRYTFSLEMRDSWERSINSAKDDFNISGNIDTPTTSAPPKKDTPKTPSTDSFSSDFSTFG